MSSPPTLHEIAASGDVEALAVAIKAGADVNEVNSDGSTPLCFAAEQGHAAATHYLILSNAEVNFKNKSGQTPMHLAAQHGHVNICRLLINGGASINSTDNAGQIPLHLACLNKLPFVTKLLLLEGADISHTDQEGLTPMALVNTDIDDPEAMERKQATFSAIREADNLKQQIELTSGDASPRATSTATIQPRLPAQRVLTSSNSEPKLVVSRSISMDQTTASMIDRKWAPPPERQAASMIETSTTMPIVASLAGITVDNMVGGLDQSLSKDLQPHKSWTREDMNFGEVLVSKLNRKQRTVLNRLAERRITELLGEALILDILQIPGTANKPKFYKRETVIPQQSFKGVIGVPLPVVLKQTGTMHFLDNHVGLKVPFIVQHCLTYLQTEGLKQDGLFRKPGNSRRMSDLQSVFDGKPTRKVDLKEYSVHDVAGLLKRFIRELPEPIFTARLQNLFFSAMELPDPRRRLVCLQLLILILPAANRDLLQALLFFLKKVDRFSDGPDGNKMNSKNLAVVFAPNMARNLTPPEKQTAPLDLQQEQEESAQSQRLVELLIDNCEQLYIFQRMKSNELPLARKSTLAGSRQRSFTEGYPTGFKSMYSKVGQSPLSQGASDAETHAFSDGAEENDENDADFDDPDSDLSDNEIDGSHSPATSDVNLSFESRQDRFLRDPGSTWPEIMANLETRMERRIRRILEKSNADGTILHLPNRGTARRPAPRKPLPQPDPLLISSPGQVMSTSLPDRYLGSPLSTSPMSAPPTTAPFKSPLRAPATSPRSPVGRSLSEQSEESTTSSHSDAENDIDMMTPVSPSGELFVFHGSTLNEEIARQFLTDLKKKHNFVFGDILKKDAKKMQLKDPRKRSASSPTPMVAHSPDASTMALLEDLEQMNLEDVLSQLKDATKGVEVKDRRKGFKLHKGVFLGKDAIDWLVDHGIKNKKLSRRQAAMIGRELLEMGAIVHVTETHGFKDDTGFYRFATSVERIPTASSKSI